MKLRLIACVATLTGLLLGAGGAILAQQAAVRSRIVKPIDASQTVQLKGNVHPLARAEFDQGALADSQPMSRMLLLLQRSPEQEVALRDLMEQQQTKSSANYRAWLTPAQFGAQFGPSDEDVQKITGWLTQQGFQVAQVAAGKTVIEFSGTAGQVKSAFQTEIHRYTVNGADYFANASDPSIPAALAPAVRGVVALHNFPKKANSIRKGEYRKDKSTGLITPLFTYGNPANFAMGPADFAKVYNIPTSGADGTGQKIAIIEESNINTQDVCDFRNIFGLTPACPAYLNATGSNGYLSVLVSGHDPGILGPSTTNEEQEADLDVEWAGAVAPNAQIFMVIAASTMSNPTQVSTGIDLAALYAVDNNVAPILSESYGTCEFDNGNEGNGFYQQLWQQAAAQGITVAVSTGDSGSAACDPTSSSPNAATQGLAVNGLGSTPYNVAVGGTDFDPSTLPTGNSNQYWSATNNGGQGSALSYIPETTWDDSACAINYSSTSQCTSVDPQGADVVAAGGGLSNCAILTSGDSSCSAGYPQPPFQTSSSLGTFLTQAKTRSLPDVSFFASNGQNGVAYIVCQSDANTTGDSCNLNSPYTDFQLIGGTSVATPSFAAVMALVNQKIGATQGLGNVNYGLYWLAAHDTNYVSGACGSSIGQTPNSNCVFNDVTKGNNSVACIGDTANCSSTNSNGYGVLVIGTNPSSGISGSNPAVAAFTAGKEYDAATGLGSINVSNLLTKWSSFARTATTTAVTGNSTLTFNSNYTATVKVTAASGTPTGYVTLIAMKSDGTQQTVGPFTLAGGTVNATTNLLPANTTSLVAMYSGDVNYAGSSGTLAVKGSGGNQPSKTVVYFVTYDNSTTPPTPTLSTSAQSITYGSPYTLKIAVTKSDGTSCEFTYPNIQPTYACPTGTITLTDNGQALNDFPKAGTANATNIATLNVLGIAEDIAVQLSGTVGSTTPGVHSIVATYSGDENYAGSSNTPLSVTVAKTASQIALASNTASLSAGQSATLTAVVSTQSNDVNAPEGTVTFYNGSTAIGTPQFMGVAASGSTGAGGTATLQYTFATAGTYNITAVYSGDPNYLASGNSNTVTITVTGSSGGGGTFTATATSATAPAGQSGSSTITITPGPQFSGAVSVTCGSLPEGVTCNPSPLSINVTGTGTSSGTLTFSVTAPSSSTSASLTGPGKEDLFAKGQMFYAAFGLAGVIFLVTLRRKDLRKAFFAGLVMSMLVLNSCGGGSSGGGGGSASTTTSMTVSSTKIASTGSLTVNAKVTSNSGTPTGAVGLFDAGTLVGTAQALSNGTASFTVTSLAVGTHALALQYSGDASHNGSASGTINVAVTGQVSVPLTFNPTIASAPSVTLTIN